MNLIKENGTKENGTMQHLLWIDRTHHHWYPVALALVTVLLFLSACNGDREASAVATATPTTALEVVVIPTVTPVSTAPGTPKDAATPIGAPTAAPDTPVATDAPVEPTLAPTPEPTAAPTRVALVRYRDNLYSRAGDFTILSSNFQVAPTGSHYDLWLLKDGEPRFRLGTIPSSEPQLNFTGAADQNLLSIYDGALLSLEPDVNTPGEVGPPVMQGIVPPNALLHIRHVAVHFADNPDGNGFLIGAEQQLALAREHTDFMQSEVAAGNLAGARRHAEHVVNILNGENGERFGDLDGDGVPQNPGDGVGVIGYLNGAKEHTELATNADDATAEVKLHGGHVLISSDNALGWTAEAVDLAMRVLAADSADEAAPAVIDLAAMLDRVRDGVDVDGDGAIVPIVGEGGLLTAYEHTLNMGAIELFPLAGGDGVAAGAATAQKETVTPVLLPTPTTEPTVPEAPTPTPVSPTPTLVPTPEVAEVTIDIVDFAFGNGPATVKAGTTVIWRNTGTKPHTATADDGSFNTGIFQPGESRSVTFDTPGTFPYYCELHGGSGGQGMASVLTVTE